MAKNKNIEPHNRLVVFQGKEVRRAWQDNEWYYSLVDVVGILTDSANPTDYLKKIRKRDVELRFYIGTNCPQVEMKTSTGKKRQMLGERMTTEISKEEKPDSFEKNKGVAKRGGKVAGNARKEAEKELGRSVVSKKNFLGKENKKKLEK